MRRRVVLGTDIALIGVWDPAFERHDLGPASHRVFWDGLRAEAEGGRLFFIETSADGGYDTDLDVDEAPDADRLSAYSAVDREFLIECRSGELVAGRMPTRRWSLVAGISAFLSGVTACHPSLNVHTP